MERHPDLKNIHSIPYNKIAYGSKIIVYGAGKVGELYVRDILSTKRYTLVSILDSNPDKKIYGVEQKIYPPESILNQQYDFVLIAVENVDVSIEMKNNMIELGVPEEKIVWNGDLEDKSFLKIFQEYNKFVKRNFCSKVKKCFLFMLPEHGNGGDYAIGLAERKFFERYFEDYTIVTVTTAEWQYASELIISYVSDEDLIFINGGGYIGDLWDDSINYRSIMESFPNNFKFFFPNTLTYKEIPNENYKPFVDEMKWFNSQKNMFTMFRDRFSYVQFLKYNKNAFFFPDMVLFEHYERANVELKSKVLLCFRGDQEKVFNQEDKIINQLEVAGFDVDKMDIYVGRHVSQESGRDFVAHIVNKMQEYDCVITDRLHGMLLATVSEVPCIAFDNRTHKVKGVYEWIEEFKYIKTFSADEDIDVALEIGNVLNCECKKFMPLYDEFNKMSQKIYECIRGE